MFFGGSFDVVTRVEPVRQLASTEEIIAECSAGHMFILVDNPDRENEGDLVIAGAHATPSAIAFMARLGRGLICVAVPGAVADRFELAFQNSSNAGEGYTAFTTSIDARYGITTGISAKDRAAAIDILNDPKKGAADIVTPGHIFPLVAKSGGVLERPGHTEASVELAKAAGAGETAVICEILGDDGEPLRLPALIDFARKHGMKIGTIADLIAWRKAQ